MSNKAIYCVIGTRPEAIKMAPVVQALRESRSFRTVLVTTGQHGAILLDALKAFDLSPDLDLRLLKQGQSLGELNARALAALDEVFNEHKPDLVLGQGDTTTAMAAAVAAFYRSIPFGHVEAGLRTPSIDSPFPEEFNRRVISLVSKLNFAPTDWARDNLLREHIPSERIEVTGNTVVDAVLSVSLKPGPEWFEDTDGRLVLLTTHRRENWGEPQKRIARALSRVVQELPDMNLVVSLHPNPDVRKTLSDILGGQERVHLIDPPDYEDFVRLMKKCHLIISDSGGVQEEAPAFGIPVLVLRENTERPEGVLAGTAKLIGTDEQQVYEETMRLLTDEQEYSSMSKAVSPYGDGKAAQRIALSCFQYLSQL